MPMRGPMLSLMAFSAGWLLENEMLFSVLYVTPPTVTLNAGLELTGLPERMAACCGEPHPVV